MNPYDPISIIFSKIKTLEPENARIIVGYLLMQNMEQVDLIRIAYGPDPLVQSLCRKALSDLGLSSNSFSGNTIARPGNIHHHQPLPQPSPRNGFLELPRNPNPLSPSLTSGTLRTNANFDSGPFRDGYFVDEQQLSNQFSFLNDGNPHANLHKRSFSANDPCPGFGGLAGYQFPQSGLVDDFGSFGGFRSPIERGNVWLLSEEMMRMELAQQQRLAAQYSANDKRQGSGQFGEDGGYYSSQSRHERDDSVSRNIYLRFPSESTFTVGQVFSYFSDFGTVDDVKIPLQDKRVFGFVSFANAETVRTILAQGNPHIIGDSVVSVKPYKDRSERQQQQQLIERDMRREADSQLGIQVEHQRRRLLTLQLPERENESISHPQPILSLNSLLLQPEGNTGKITEGPGPRMMIRKADSEVEVQRRRLLTLQLPERENESIPHPQPSLSLDSLTDFPPLLLQPERNTQGESDIGESHPQLVANRNEGNNGQGTSRENTVPDSVFGPPESLKKPASKIRQPHQINQPSKR